MTYVFPIYQVKGVRNNMAKSLFESCGWADGALPTGGFLEEEHHDAVEDDDEDDVDDTSGEHGDEGGAHAGAGAAGGAGGRAGPKKTKDKRTYKMFMMKHPISGVMTPIFWDRLADIFARRQAANGVKALHPKLSQRVFACATDGSTAPLMVVALATALFSQKMMLIDKVSIESLRDPESEVTFASTEEERERDACMLEAVLPLKVFFKSFIGEKLKLTLLIKSILFYYQ